MSMPPSNSKSDKCIRVHIDDEMASDLRTLKSKRYLQKPILLLLFLSILLLLPILVDGFPRSSDDGETHVRWQFYFGRQLWAGDIFPRWISEIADGFGSPAFFIYPPLPHYLAGLLTPLSSSLTWVQHRLAIATAFAFFLSGVGSYLWLRQVTHDRSSALIGAIVYLLAPYHLFIDTYFRSSYAELWAIACAPFALVGVNYLASKQRMGILLCTIAISFLLMSHAPSALILLPFFVIYSCLLSVSLRRLDIILWTGVACFNAILIAGIYLGTALTQQIYIHTEELYTGYFNFYNWLIFAHNPVSKLAFDSTGILQAGITIVLAAGSLMTAHQKMERWYACATLVGTCLLFFMMTSFSAAIWELIPFARKIQFPWRLQTAQTILLALSAALFLRATLSVWREKTPYGSSSLPDWNGLLVILGLLSINVAMYYHATPRFDIAAPIRTLETTEYTLGDRISGGKIFEGRGKAFISEGSGSLHLVRWKPRDIEFDVNSTTVTKVLIKQFTYTGWTCRTPNGPDACRVLSSKTGDILHVQVSPGMRRITLIMPETSAERLGKIASLIGLLFTGLSVLCAGMWRRRKVGTTGQTFHTDNLS
jgi:hypothetical protein